MRWILILLAGACGLQAQDFNNAQLTLGPSRSPMEMPKKESAPIQSAILSTVYDLALSGGSLEGTATFTVQTFTNEDHLIPLIGSAARVSSIDPAETLLVLQDEFYTVAVQGKKKVKIALKFSLPLLGEAGEEVGDLKLSPCAISVLRLRGVAEDQSAMISGVPSARKEGDAQVWEMGGTSRFYFTIQKIEEKPPAVDPGPRVDMPAIVRTASSQMRVVQDGSYLNSIKWSIRHEKEMNWTLTMPADCQLLACKVAGETVAPIQQDAVTWVIPLPVSRQRDETPVEFTYSGRQAAFEPVRGEFVGTLPGTSLLIEKLEWQLQLPRLYEVVAIQGNVGFVPGANSGELNLTRELGRGETTRVHVFYQKPEIAKK